MAAIRPQTAARVLVADDQPDVLEALRWLLTGEGYEPEFVSSTEAVLERLKNTKDTKERPFDLLLMDLNYSRDTTSGREGLELIPRVREHDPTLPIVVMTGWGSVDTAVMGDPTEILDGNSHCPPQLMAAPRGRCSAHAPAPHA